MANGLQLHKTPFIAGIYSSVGIHKIQIPIKTKKEKNEFYTFKWYEKQGSLQRQGSKTMAQIKARTETNEKVWIFFSLLTSNASQIAKRMQMAQRRSQAA